MRYVGDGNQIINWNYKIELEGEYQNHFLTHMFDKTGIIYGTAEIVIDVNSDTNVSINPEFSALIVPIGKEETLTKVDTHESYKVYWPHIFEENIIDWVKENPTGFTDYLKDYTDANPGLYPDFVDKERSYEECILEFPEIFVIFFSAGEPGENINPGRFDETRTRIVARYVWHEFEGNYVEFIAIKPENTLDTDVIIVDYETDRTLTGDPDNDPVWIVSGSLDYSNQVTPQMNSNLFSQSDSGECVIVEDTTADTLNGYQAGNVLDIPINNGTLNVGLDSDVLGGYHAGHEVGKLSISDGVLNDNLVAEQIGSVTEFIGQTIYPGNDSESLFRIPISNRILCHRLNCQYFNGREGHEIFYGTHLHTLDDGELNSILDDEAPTDEGVYKKVAGVDNDNIATTLSIENDAFEYKHQSTQNIDEAFYVTNFDGAFKRFFSQYNRGENDYRVNVPDVIYVPAQEWEVDAVNDNPLILGGPSVTTGFRYNSGYQIIYDINIVSNMCNFKTYGVQTTNTTDIQGDILTALPTDVVDLSWIVIGERKDL